MKLRLASRWKGIVLTNTDGISINGSRRISGFAWKRWWGLSRGWAIHLNITAAAAHELGADVESLITLNVLHELSHLCAPKSATGIHGGDETWNTVMNINIVRWNRYLARAMGHRKMRAAFCAQLAALLAIRERELSEQGT